MKKDRYIYPAILDFADDGISVEFPDLPGCLTCGDTEEALRMAKDALSLHLYGMERDGDNIPEPSHIKDIKTEQNQSIALIEVFMKAYRSKRANKAIKKTLTIPQWLNDVAEEREVNFSHLLTDALKKHLDIDDKEAL